MTDDPKVTLIANAEAYVEERARYARAIAAEHDRTWQSGAEEFDAWLDRVKREAAAAALEEAAREINRAVAVEMFGDANPGQTGNWGKADGWAMHKRRNWAAGADAILSRLRARAAAIREQAAP